ncbi:hypothetical protein G6F57_012065 [Rhizopus arrhizus]|nr:hypothetical protein G6F23_009544 [Rhizopus arrhizus]KAG1407666.1 hypothetical protein G6F58_009623 [Rhizopus delemar]KAG0755738.1 hypothetical protein G6F24_011628 [Rhizopus arrhizus]KAG0782218.1 hypothetical protein G6F21_011230 [Rhizopus arrhizus]KAG0785685.1 hypothetical protein G6F22_007877 [Rhizopus arrhizus]
MEIEDEDTVLGPALFGVEAVERSLTRIKKTRINISPPTNTLIQHEQQPKLIRHQQQRKTIQTSTNQQKNYSIPEDGILPGGRLIHFANNWKKITSHSWPLSVIQSWYQLQFVKKPSPWKLKKIHHSPTDQMAVDAAIEKFIKAGIIYQSPTQNRDYLSNFFTIEEPMKRRPILDCTNLNKFLQIQHFKMEGIPALRDIIEKDDYLCKIDLKDAYVVIPIHKDSQPFLALENRGIVYNYASLAFGLSLAPRIFTKLMRYAVEPLRAQGIRLIYYLDDICILEKSKIKMTETINLCDRTEQGSRISRIQDKLQGDEDFPPTNQAGLLGKITSVIPAIAEALLHIRHIQQDLARSLQLAHHRWDQPCQLSAKSLMEIQWWKQNLMQKNGLPIHQIQLSQTALTVHVDASDTGWGVHRQVVSKAGYLTEKEKACSINVRELTAIYYALLLHVRNSRVKEINLHTDNMTALNNTDTGPTQSTPAECLLPSCGGSEEHGSRHPQSSQTISVRVIHSKSLLQPSEGQMGKTMEDRCLCGLTQQSTQKILEHEQRPVCQQDRCLSTNLDQKRPLYVPSVEADSANFAKTQIRQNQGSDAGNTSMDKSILVPNATQDETPQRANNLEDKPMESYRVALINNKRKGLGMSDQLIVYLNKANRPSTT